MGGDANAPVPCAIRPIERGECWDAESPAVITLYGQWHHSATDSDTPF